MEHPLETVLTGLGITFMILGGSTERNLKWLGTRRVGEFVPGSPNWISVWGALIYLVGFVVYMSGSYEAGIMITLVGGLLDRIDGKMAAVMNNRQVRGLGDPGFASWWCEMNWPGATDLGTVLDPALDKIKVLFTAAYFVAIGELGLVPCLAMMVPELIGTLIRRPFFFWPSQVQGSKATALGKLKAIAQWIVFIVAIFFQHRWFTEVRWTLDVLLWLAVSLSWLSLLSRLRIAWRTPLIAQLLTMFNRQWKHETPPL